MVSVKLRGFKFTGCDECHRIIEKSELIQFTDFQKINKHTPRRKPTGTHLDF